MSGKYLTEEHEILNRWTEYCSNLYNYETDGDPTVLEHPQIPDEELHPILREEAEAAVKAPKMERSAVVDNIRTELVQAGDAMIDILTAICNKIWKTREWPTSWTQSLVNTLPKKGNMQLCQNYRTISHHSKVKLKIILNRLQPQAEEIIAEEQAGFRHNKYSISRSSARNTCSISKSLSCLHRLQEVLWQGMARSFMGNIIRVIENLDKAQNAVLFHGSTWDWFTWAANMCQYILAVYWRLSAFWENDSKKRCFVIRFIKKT